MIDVERPWQSTNEVVVAREGIYLDLPADLKYLNVVGAGIRSILEGVGRCHEAQAFSPNPSPEYRGGETEPRPDEEERDLVTDMELAVCEACTNIVVHAYDGSEGRIQVGAWLAEVAGRRALLIETHDTGPNTFDFSHVAEPDLEQVQEHGYGLFLMRQLLDEIGYEGRPGDSRWRLVKYLEPR
jgi:serine/threonine-protein kinase RsbW